MVSENYIKYLKKKKFVKKFIKNERLKVFYFLPLPKHLS